VLAVTTVASLVALLVTVVGGTGGSDNGPPSTSGSGTAAPDEQRRDTNDPLPPQNRATLDPSTRSDTEAAVRGNWPLLMNDEFDGTDLDRTYWHPYSGETTGGIGRHDPDNLSVGNGMLSVDSHDNTSGGMAWMPGQQYGRWEVRARTQVGTGYGPVILLWPDAEDFPRGGEIDFMEIPHGDRQESNFVLHFGKNNSQNGTAVPGDFTQWHNYAVEWAPDHVAGFIDGQEIFRTSDPSQIPPRPMHLAIQQDIGPYGNGWVPPPDDTTPDKVTLQVDWVRIYGLSPR
jgi:Beta-glucanase/Beta-glucan synthetase